MELPKLPKTDLNFDHNVCTECKKLTLRRNMFDSNDGYLYCWPCCEKLNMCEICGSIANSEILDGGVEQVHYDEMCFQ